MLLKRPEVLMPTVRTVGVNRRVMGDHRTYEWVCCLRAVNTTDFMTAVLLVTRIHGNYCTWYTTAIYSSTQYRKYFDARITSATLYIELKRPSVHYMYTDLHGTKAT